MIRFNVKAVGFSAKKFDVKAGQNALEQAVVNSCDQYVPYNTGRLAESVRHVGGAVEYTAEYAGECYYANRSFNLKKHPKACARWFEAAKAVSLAEWTSAAAGGLAGGGRTGTERR